MDSNTTAFAASVVAFLVSYWVLRAHRVEFSLSCAVVLTPLAHIEFMPQNTFGVPGISLVNVVLLVAATSVLHEMGMPDAIRNLKRYFDWPLLLFGLLFAVAVLRTGMNVDALLPGTSEARPTAFRVLVLDGLLSAKFLIVGYLVALYGIRHRALDPIEKALLVLPMVLLPIALGYFAEGASSLGFQSGQYHGRRAISENLGIHANYLGRMALYLLLFALTSRNQPWPRVRWVSVLCSVSLIALSFSRTTWVMAPILILVALRSGSRFERIAVATCILVGTLALLPYLSERSKYGLRETDEDATAVTLQEQVEEVLDRVTAGRTGTMWPTVIPIFVDHPILGQGLYSVWKPVDPEAPRLGYNHPHNAYLEVALDMGLLGLASLGWLLWSFWQTSARYRPFRYLLVGWAVMSLTGDSFYPQQQNALNWILLGMAVAAREEDTAANR